MLAYADRSLTVKFIFPLILSILAVLAAGGFFLRNQLRGDLEAQTDIALEALKTEQESGAEAQRHLLASKADIVGKFLVETSVEFLLSYDYMTVANLKQIAETDPEIAYALFLEPDGSAIDGSKIPEDQQGITRRSYPIVSVGEEIGTVLIGLSQDRLQKQLAESENRAALVQEKVKAFGERTLRGLTGTMMFSYALLLLISTALVSLLFRRMVVRPLHRMVSVIEDMGQGRLDGRLRMPRVDEIGRISRAMDEMAERLENTVRRIDGSAGELVTASGSIEKVSRQVSESGVSQAKGVGETHSAVRIIDDSAERIALRMGELAKAATESSSSILEMSSSVDEVAGNAGELATSAEEVGSSIGEIAVSIRQVAESAEVLKGVSDSTASSVVEMDANVREVEIVTKETAKITEKVRRDAEIGKSSVEAVIVGMDQIRTASGTVSTAVASLSEQTEKIGSVLAVINDVTDQTNLLALNAAIIAAQAGEHGKGFGVVAEEIREMANRTGGSTGEIAAMVHAVQQETERAVQAIRQAEGNVAEGEVLSKRSGEALEKIVEGIRDLDQRMERIARTTIEQAQGTKMIRDAMGQVSDMVDQTATAIGEQKRAAEMIQLAAERMRELAGKVRSSTQEQSEGSKQLVRTVETINDMVREINRACEEQRLKSGQIMQVVEEIRVSSESSIESTSILRQAVETQNSQIVVLKEEVNFFKIAH